MSTTPRHTWSQGTHPGPHEPGPYVGLATVALVLCATLAFAEVFIGSGALWPLLGAAVAALAVGWGGRALRMPAWAVTVASLLAAGWYAILVFAPETLTFGILPTPASPGAVGAVWLDGMELVQLRPTPALPEPPLIILAVAGVWACAHTVDGLVLRLRSPLAGVVMALVLWAVPLTLAGVRGFTTALVVPLLASVGALLLAVAHEERARFGQWVGLQAVGPGAAGPGGVGARGRSRDREHRARWRAPVAVAWVGAAMAGVVLLAALPAAQALPGHGEEPWVDVTELGDPTLADNPIVDMQQRLVSSDPTTVLRVRSNRPVYLKTTSLDRYDEQERWTNDGIDGRRFAEIVPLKYPPRVTEPATVEVEVVGDLGSRAVLLPAPFPSLFLAGETRQRLRYDRDLATFTLPSDAPLGEGDGYQATAVLPSPAPEALRTATTPDSPQLLALPGDVPEQVGELARGIVSRAGAVNPYEQALAIQQELRSWTYSLDIPGGHSATAMERFLEARTGYCEQFAGTMAVMLRALGIPARVAVGFTPGQLVEAGEDGQPSTWAISWANLHAWPEVLFREHGWMAFEPTPRSDGNVLVPGQGDVTPDELERTTSAGVDFGGLDPDLAAAARAEAAAMEALQNQQGLSGGSTSTAGRGSGVARVGAAGLGLVVVLALAALLVLGLSARRHRRGRTLPERQRVLMAMQRLTTLAAARGQGPQPHETDAEFLDRLLVGLESGRRARLLVPAAGDGRGAAAGGRGPAPLGGGARPVGALLGHRRRRPRGGRGGAARRGPAAWGPHPSPGAHGAPTVGLAAAARAPTDR